MTTGNKLEISRPHVEQWTDLYLQECSQTRQQCMMNQEQTACGVIASGLSYRSEIPPLLCRFLLLCSCDWAFPINENLWREH